MKHIYRTAALLLFLLLLAPCSMVRADEEQESVQDLETTAVSEETVEQNEDAVTRRASAPADETLYKQIQDTYKAAKKRSRRSSFKGYCGSYVANQLVVLGINSSYLSANGKNTYDIYRNMECTTGGYRVSAYGAKKYSLGEALGEIMRQDPSPNNILVGFERGTSSAGKKYGHVLFIHGIRNGRIYFSDSSARTVDKVKYKEGEPIVCSLAAFMDEYASYKLDGVVFFQKADKPSQPSIIEKTSGSSSEKESAQG